MDKTFIQPVRVPDEIKFILVGISERFPKIADLNPEDGGITLRELTSEDKIALNFLDIVGELEGIFRNINLTLRDLERMKVDPHWHGAGSPIERLKLAMRICFYEYGRFEDIFALHTMWLCKHGFISKSERKELRQDFHDQNKPLIRGRNTLLHDSPNWKEWQTPEITLLQGSELFEMQLVSKTTGDRLEWINHIGPKCDEAVKLWTGIGKKMATCWSMLLADATKRFVDSGAIKKAKRPYPKKDGAIRHMRAEGLLASSGELGAAEMQDLKRRMHTISVLLKEFTNHPALSKRGGKERKSKE